MLSFRKIKLDDKKWIDEILKSSDFMSSDNAFGTMFVWSNVYNLEICCEDGILFRRYGKENKSYAFPIGAGNIKSSINLIASAEFEKNEDFKLVGITQRMKEQLEKMYPDKFEFFLTEEYSEYVYNVSDLAYLEGKKYHSKRNHVAKFEKLYNWSYEEVSNENIADCKKIADDWCKKSKYCSENGGNDEFCALSKTFNNFEKLDFVGGLIKVDGMPVAFEIGEKINNDVFVVHFEKANSDYQGAYAIINREFVKNELMSYKYVNREEDLGIEGLRKAKRSYHPEILLKKFDAVMRKA